MYIYIYIHDALQFAKEYYPVTDDMTESIMNSRN